MSRAPLYIGGGLFLAGLFLLGNAANAAEPASAPGNPRRTRRNVNADDLLRIANQKLGQKYVLGANVPKNDPAWMGPWDCAEFVTWALYQTTGKLYGVANPAGDPSKEGSWTGHWTAIARTQSQGVRRIPVADAIRTPGAILLRYPQPGSYGHIAISDGAGGTIEAMGTSYGVTKGKANGRRWDTGLLVDSVAPGAVSAVAIEPVPRILRMGSTGDDVKALQARLNLTPDGIFGPATVRAVTVWQAQHGLVPDGEVGPNTLRSLAA